MIERKISVLHDTHRTPDLIIKSKYVHTFLAYDKTCRRKRRERELIIAFVYYFDRQLNISFVHRN